MQIIFNTDKSKYKNGYLTVYLSLIFGIILSLLLALIEGAAIGASRIQSEMVADLGMDSVFAEYHQELQEQYDVFFIDSSYATAHGSIGNVQSHLSQFMSYNMNPTLDKKFYGKTSLLLLNNPYLEVVEVAFATDESANVWKKQTVNYMKELCGLNQMTNLLNQIHTVEDKGILTDNIQQEIQQQKDVFDKALNDKRQEILEKGEKPQEAVTDEGISYESISQGWNELKEYKAVNKVLQNVNSISTKAINETEYVTFREKQKNINIGAGLTHTQNKYSSTDEIFYNEYLMKKCGNYLEPAQKGRLSYEIEYILFGQSSDRANLNECIEKLLTVRTASNYLQFQTGDSGKKSKAQVISTILCSILMIPEMTEVLTQVILGYWAYETAVSDVKILIQGGTVTEIANMEMSYTDYLKIFLFTTNVDKKTMRSLDIVEMNIRETQGNQYFRIDQCIDYLKVTFGFQDSGKHEFVFSKEMCYESY